MKKKTRRKLILIVGIVLFLGIGFFIGSLIRHYSIKKTIFIPGITKRLTTTTTTLPIKTSPTPPYLSSFSVPILMYHYIRDYNKEDDPIGIKLSVSPEKFGEQMKWLADNGYQVITTDNLISKEVPAKAIILTFDDGYKDFYTNAFSILKKYHFRGTVYIITSELDKKKDYYISWEELKEMAAVGINVGSHSVSHLDLEKANDQDRREEIFGSKKELQEKLGINITDFCYPSGKYNDDVINLVKEAGYTNATTIEKGFDNQETNPYKLTRTRINNDTNFAELLKQ